MLLDLNHLDRDTLGCANLIDIRGYHAFQHQRYEGIQ